MRPRISVLSIGVADLARSRKFYEEGMGLKPRPESSERAVFFELEWSWLSLFQRDRLAGLARVPAEGSGFQGFVFSHNVSSAAEVDAVMAQAVAAAAPRPALPKTARSGASAISPTPTASCGR